MASPQAAGVGYIEAVTGGARPEETLPLIVALHGYGDSPEAFMDLYRGLPSRARVVALRGTVPMGDGAAWYVPGGDRAAGIRGAADTVAAAMAVIARSRPTCGLPVVTGFSQGGMIAYALAVRSPSVVRAAAPLGGMLPEALRPSPRMVGGLLPSVQGFHGEADPRVPVADARQTAAWLRAAGFPMVLTTEPGVGHTVTPTMRAGLYTFLARVARCDDTGRE